MSVYLSVSNVIYIIIKTSNVRRYTVVEYYIVRLSWCIADIMYDDGESQEEQKIATHLLKMAR